MPPDNVMDMERRLALPDASFDLPVDADADDDNTLGYSGLV